jgi:uncharacterized membrane protein YeaQ/YmgE (transglycosylase-associated protein family)
VELAVDLGLGGFVLVIIGGLIFGGVALLIGEPRTGYEGLVDGIAFCVGAIVASECITAFQDSGPMFDGLAVLPALAGGIVVGLVVEIVTRFVTGGTYTHGAASA